VFGSCHKPKMPTQTVATQPTSVAAPSILFLQIKVSRKEDIYEAQIISRQEVAGILDKNISGIQLYENQWLISFFDDKKNILDQIVVPNPLDEHFEVADDKGQFKNVEVKKQAAEFFFRVQSNPKFKSLQVEQILPDQKKKKLFSLIF
jgi:hypothetical protein